MTTENLVTDLLISTVTGSGISATILLIGKKWLTKSIDHSFDKQLENYKAILGRETAGYQIEKAEFAKKKFEHVTDLYSLLLERAKRNEDFYSIISEHGFQQVRQRFDTDRNFVRKAQDSISFASLYLEESLVKLIKNYFQRSDMLITILVTIAENRILKRDYENPKQYMYLRVIASNPDNEYDEISAIDELNQMGKLTKDAFEKANVGLRRFLTIE